jgi:hypothetical protein
MPSPDGNQTCITPVIQVKITMDPNGTVGSGRIISLGETFSNGSSCQVVVVSKTVVQPDSNATSNPPSMGRYGAAGGGGAGGGTGGSGGGGSSPCTNSATKGLQAGMSQFAKGGTIGVDARLRYWSDSCNVYVYGTRGYCTYNTSTQAAQCTTTTGTSGNPVFFETFGDIYDYGQAYHATMDAKARGYRGGGADCVFSETHYGGSPYQLEQHCYWIDPYSF